MHHSYHRVLCLTLLACAAYAQKTVTTTGGTANNVAKFSGTTTIVDSAIYENNGKVGIGTTSPGATLNVVNAPTATSGTFINSFLQMSPNPTAASSAEYIGLDVDTASKLGSSLNFSSPLFGSLFAVDHYGTGTVASAYGLEGQVSNRSSGILTDAYSLWLQVQNTGKGTITNGYGMRVGAPVNTGGGKITNYYGIYLESPTAGSTNYALYSAGGTSYFAGNVGIGVTAPTSPLTVKGVIQSTSGGFKFPDGTTQTTAEATGPRGPTGLTGPTGPQGPSLSLPYSGTVGSGSVAFQIQNTGGPSSNGNVPPGNAIEGDGGGGGIGVVGVGSDSYCMGDYGCWSGGAGVSAQGGGFGGPSAANGGDGIDATGGSTPVGSGGYGISASGGQNYDGTDNYAGYFNGDVDVTGTLSKSAGSFKIDDPVDPANKYLYHSFVESPDMKNIYDGVVTTDRDGSATVTLPDWFEALNRDFRYQLTVIGQFAQAIVASKIAGNRFTVRTDKPKVEVSWQVTGIRQDAYANAHRIPVEQDKSEKERNHYLHPELFGQAEEGSILNADRPDLFKRMQQSRAAASNAHR